MNSYIILKRFKNQRECTLAEYIIFNEKVYLTKILINNDKHFSFTKVSLDCTNTEGLTLRYKYNLDYIYTYSSKFNYYYGGSVIPLDSLRIEIIPYDIPFAAENDDEAKLRFELDE